MLDANVTARYLIQASWSRHRWVAIIGVMVFISPIVLGCTESYELPSRCDDLEGQVISLSEDNASPFTPAILKLYNVQRVESTEGRYLECTGDALTSWGEEERIRFYTWQDADNDWFVGYEPDLKN